MGILLRTIFVLFVICGYTYFAIDWIGFEEGSLLKYILLYILAFAGLSIILSILKTMAKGALSDG